MSNGHLAISLAAGMLDGLVELESGPVVVRAVGHKAAYQKSQRVEVRNGTRHKITVKAERPELVLRVLDSEGRIFEYS